MAFKDKSKAVAYINQYNAQRYDRVTTMLPKGEKDEVKAHAATQGESMNEFIRRAIREAMNRDKESAGE